MTKQAIAYFSMEVALNDQVPTFSGGLGVLAGDFLKAASDLSIPLVGVTLLYHEGFFRQTIEEGLQVEHAVRWTPGEQLERLDAQVEITLSGRPVVVGVWRRVVTGTDGGTVPVYFLDTRLAANDPEAQAITDRLYIGDRRQRLTQEGVLGLAGPALLEVLGHRITTYHLNEGHAALVPVALLSQRVDGKVSQAVPADIEWVREQCVFTTHTPVPAGHDRFEREVTVEVLGQELADDLSRIGCLEDDVLNMTQLGMFFSGFINAVAQRHGDVSRAMFPTFRIEAITNGVHAPTWVGPSTSRLLDHHVPAWRSDDELIRYASLIPLEEIRAAHAEAKHMMLEEVARRTGISLEPDTLTVGVARRATPYKRNDLLLSQPDRLRALAGRIGQLQILYSGKAHPQDEAGKKLIARINEIAHQLRDSVAVVYLEDYGMDLAALLVAGVDVWLNNPVAPHEASGTSGMKAALNGVPSLSILDGWWLEGHVEGVTGWAIGTDCGPDADLATAGPQSDRDDAEELYRLLEEKVAPLYYKDPDAFAAVGRSALALNGSFFTARRMVSEYVSRAYPAGARSGRA